MTSLAPTEKSQLVDSESNQPGNFQTMGSVSMATSEVQLMGDELEEDAGPKWFNEYLRPCVAELVAVMLFVFVGTMAVQAEALIAIASAHGFMIALLVASIGPISGGHINPAVTLGVCLGGGVGPIKAVLYVISQLVGAIIGAALTMGSLSYTVTVDNVTMTQFEAIGGGGHALAPGVTVGMGILAEAGLTTVLVFTVLMTAVNTDAQNVIHPLCIGLAVLADILAGAKTTGASMNPARSFGPAVVLSGSTKAASLWTNHWVYWVGPAIGSLVAAALFRFLFARPDKRLVYKED